MTPAELARAFQEGRFDAPRGPLVPKRALFTRKSLLLFTPDVVLKLRRPREVDGYDQSLMSVRYAMSARERWLGRQLSPEVYFEDVVLRLDGPGGRCALLPGTGEGEPIVAMRRLPDGHRADRLLLEGASPDLVRRQLDLAMQQLARFHANAEQHGQPPFGDPGRPKARFEAVMAKLAPALEESERSQLENETLAWLAALLPTLARRVAERRIRSVHGELRLEHIFLPGDALAGSLGSVAFIDPNDGPDGERAIDTAEEVMSLAIELDVFIGNEATNRAIETYATHTADATLRKVSRFYKRLACLHRAAEALAEAAEPDVSFEEGTARVRFFIERAQRV